MDPTFNPTAELQAIFPTRTVTAYQEEMTKEPGDLARAARTLVSRLLADLAVRGLAPLRLWNWIPDINHGADAEGHGPDEHYKQFNRGRREAWLAHDSTLGSVCSATAVGRQDGVWSLESYALGTRHPVVHLENPRQIPFLGYSALYGPPPCARRATLELAPEGLTLFIAGTSSIRGERTVHAESGPRRLAWQLEETLENLACLLSPDTLRDQVPDRRITRALRWRMEGVRVYLRDIRAAGRVAPRIADRLEIEPSVMNFIPADICRRPLDVEIELTALQCA